MARSYQQIVNFLQELDQRLNKKFDLFVVGGGSITLFYDHQNTTLDIDAVEVDARILKIAGEKSALAEKHKVYIQKISEVGFSAPKDWKTKTKLLKDLSFMHLAIYVADIHDVVLGKFARLEARDIKDISGLFKNGHINIDFLLKRLNQNTKELMNQEYKNNVKLAFEVIFGKKIIFRQGKALLSKK